MRALITAMLLLSSTFVSGILYPSHARAQDGTLPPGDDARVTRVVSGDTIEVVIKGIGFTIGYIGVDAPNPATTKTAAECYARQSTNANRALVGGKTVRVTRDTSDFDANGRLLRYVYLPDGRLVNELQLATGNARAASVAPDTQLQDRLAQAEQAARTGRKGMWKSCPGAEKPASVPVGTPAAQGGCILVPLYDLVARGPRPAALNGVSPGSCVTIALDNTAGQYTWWPAGSRLRLDRSMLVRWQDALVSIRYDPDGQLRAGVLEGNYTVRPDGPYSYKSTHPEVADRELVRAGERGQLLALSNGTLLFEDAGGGEFVTLVDAMQHVSGSFSRNRFELGVPWVWYAMP